MTELVLKNKKKICNQIYIFCFQSVFRCTADQSYHEVADLSAVLCSPLQTSSWA